MKTQMTERDKKLLVGMFIFVIIVAIGYWGIIPQIKEGIVSGALVAFTMSFDDFVISYFTTGPGINNISTYVYATTKRINPSVNALSTIIVLAITIVLIFSNVMPMLKARRKNDEKTA